MQTVFEVRTYWRGDLMDVAHSVTEPPTELAAGPLTVVVSRVRAAMERPIAQPTDWAFARVLCLTAIVELVLFGLFLLTPRDDLTYVLGDRLGSMKSLPGPDWVGRTRPAMFVREPGAAEGERGATLRRGPLLSSPPGSRTYQRPAVEGVLAQLLAAEPTNVWGTSALVDSLASTEGVLGGIVGNEIGEAFGAGGLGLSGIGEGGGGRGAGIGFGNIPKLNRVEGAVATGRGYGRVGRLVTQRPVDDKTRVVYCDEIVDYVLDLMPDHEPSRPTRAALYRTCRTTSAVKTMTCIGRAKDKRDRRIELLLRCGDGMPALFKDALTKEGRRE